MEQRRIVVIGNGMVGHRFSQRLVELDSEEHLAITVVGEEQRPAYDRVALTSWFTSRADDALDLAHSPASARVETLLGRRATFIDVDAGKVQLDTGELMAFDDVVIATGSTPFVPPLPGNDSDGCFVYRTIDDLAAIDAWAGRPDCRSGIVIGGGLLGLEAADALRQLGLDVTVVELAPNPMPQQLGADGGAMLGRWMTETGTTLRCGMTPVHVATDEHGSVTGLVMEDGSVVDGDIVVFSAGIRPRDELARVSGIDVGPRGGVVVDDRLATSRERVWAIGEVALHRDRIYGLVGPGYEMADVLADQLLGGTREYRGSDLSTKLKLLDVDVASFGASTAAGENIHEIVFSDPISKIYRRLAICVATGELLGGVLVGDASGYDLLRAIALGDLPVPDDLSAMVLPASIRPPDDLSLPDAAVVCSCNAVAAGGIRDAVSVGCRSIAELKESTTAGTSCGGCVPSIVQLLNTELTALGEDVSTALCGHFEHSRRELFELVQRGGQRSWTDVADAHGVDGQGCEVCRPTVASILASLAAGYILDGDQIALQDTNDLHLANMQRNGTYSVVPRVPAGEITPDQLIALGQIAKEFDLYTKITGGQRIDLLGAHLQDLPTIWSQVIDAGMESGHAYGKSLRTVKSCVGSTWCRYGVQDSVSMAVRIEERYRGLRSPHKIKMAVSGCTRECAEAQSKDVGVIATETGWNLYVGGNGGRSPRHADLFATDLDDQELITAIDRVLIYYVRTADKLQRTSTWVESLDGGVEELRRVVLEDSLGIGAELEADMQTHVDSYECEWAATLADPARLEHFVEFVNAPDTNSTPVWITERGQRVPA